MQEFRMSIIWILSVGALLFLSVFYQPSTDSFLGYMDNAEQTVTTDVGGQIKKIHVLVGEQVVPGQLLVDLEDINLEIEMNSVAYKIEKLQMEKKIGTNLVPEVTTGNRRTPMDIELAQLKENKSLLEKKKYSLSVRATQPGVVGKILVSPGQYVAPFFSLLMIYSASPNLVNGFLHEDSLINLHRGSEVDVVSYSDSRKHAKGIVINVGERFEFLPERLKTPATASALAWGRLVQISVAKGNNFLPSEKVRINSQGNFSEYFSKYLVLSNKKTSAVKQ